MHDNFSLVTNSKNMFRRCIDDVRQYPVTHFFSWGKLISLALFISPVFCVFFKLEYSRLKNNSLI